MAKVELWFQDAGKTSGYLLEVLLEAVADATSGGAIFAWGNVAGIRAFLGDEKFTEFIQNGQFDLVVGLDSITDEAAIKWLIAADERLPNLSVRAFLNSQSGMFHPKLAWFRKDGHLTLVVGSGNLTTGGLKANWEAFALSQLDGDEAEVVAAQISGWLEEWDLTLLDIADPSVIARAKKNSGDERSLRRQPKSPTKDIAVDDANSILIAEIPKSDVRWSQANFDVENYETFFGAKVGAQTRITLYAVDDHAELGELESRPSVQVRSHNYRFELAAASGKSYPGNGRPIGVFMRLSTGDFLYILRLPKQTGYGELSKFLDSHWHGRAGRMRRIRTGVAEAKAAWPSSPLWRAKLPKL